MFSLNRFDFQNGDLETMLAEDSSGKTAAGLLDKLAEGQRKVKNAMNQGLTPAEFEIGEKILDSYAAAVEGVEWLRELANPR